ncbi:MAG: hypothetical protein IK137_02575 [Bacilli bacterium]|nr:hypothetical protein [Bacilli bacterium]
MNKELIYIIKNNELINRFLKEESIHYKYLYRDNNYINKIEKLAKEKYGLTLSNKISNISNTINLINTFMSVID